MDGCRINLTEPTYGYGYDTNVPGIWLASYRDSSISAIFFSRRRMALSALRRITPPRVRVVALQHARTNDSSVSRPMARWHIARIMLAYCSSGAPSFATEFAHFLFRVLLPLSVGISRTTHDVAAGPAGPVSYTHLTLPTILLV